jgi:hypothetical protein
VVAPLGVLRVVAVANAKGAAMKANEQRALEYAIEEGITIEAGNDKEVQYLLNTVQRAGQACTVVVVEAESEQPQVAKP